MSQPSSLSRAKAYKEAGVDIEAGNAVVSRIKALVAQTHTHGVLSDIGGFGGLFKPDMDNIESPVLVASTDGVGTKLKLAFAFNHHSSVGIDLVAMSVNDILVQGARPLFFLDYFATGKLDVGLTETVIAGIAEGCRQAGCALLGGETAEMPDMYAPGEYDLAGFTVAAVEKDELLDGAAVAEGDVLIGIASSGPHSNGYSLIRKIYERAGSPTDVVLEDGTPLVDALMAPTQLYVKPVLSLLASNRADIHGMAHITGGGLTENIIRVVPEGLGLSIDAASIVLPPVFAWLKENGNVADAEMWRTFNCGIGFVLIVPADRAAAVGEAIDALGLAHRQIGRVVADAGQGERVHIG